MRSGSTCIGKEWAQQYSFAIFYTPHGQPVTPGFSVCPCRCQEASRERINSLFSAKHILRVKSLISLLGGTATEEIARQISPSNCALVLRRMPVTPWVAAIDRFELECTGAVAARGHAHRAVEYRLLRVERTTHRRGSISILIAGSIGSVLGLFSD